jgi:ABC-type transport system substrate-binding protein
MKKIIVLLFIFFNILSLGSVEDYTLHSNLQKDSIKILQELRVTTLDPITLNDIYSKRAFKYIYETLFKIDENGVITPYLAEKYRYLDNKKLYIKLKVEKKFSDGTLLTTNHVKTSLLRVKEKGALKEFYKNIEQIEILNKQELIIHLKDEDRLLLNLLSHSMSSIIKEKNGKILGTGDYIVEVFEKDDLILKNITNPKKKIIIERVFSPKDRILSLFNDNSDIVYDISSYYIEREKKLQLIDLNKTSIKKSENIVTSALIFNEKRELEFKKSIEALLHQEAPYILPSEIYGENISKLEKNSNSMKKYLTSLNSKEKKIDLMILNTEEDRKYAQEIKEDLKKAGLNINILPYQIDAFYYKLKEKDFDVALQHIVFNKIYPEISLGKVILYDIYDKSLYEELISYANKIENEKDIDKKREDFFEMIDEISKKLPYIPLKHEPLYILSNKDIDI